MSTNSLKLSGAGSPLERPEDWVMRPAKLFEAGSYPDRGLEVSEEQLRTLQTNFDRPVPVLVEHGESPLELGWLTRVEARGGELFGTVALTPEADALARRSGAQSLSVGLSAELDRICEVSLVQNPRVPTARLFGEGPRMEGTLDASVDWERQYRELQRAQREREAGRWVEEHVRAGKLTPAQAPIARALLACAAPVQFGGEAVSASALAKQLIESMPGASWFGQTTPEQDQEAAEHLLLPEEAEFYRRHFPGVDLGEIARRR